MIPCNYQTKLTVDVAYSLLRFAPPIIEDPTLMTQADYDELIDDKISALCTMQCESPLECFLKNAPVFFFFFFAMRTVFATWDIWSHTK